MWMPDGPCPENAKQIGCGYVCKTKIEGDKPLLVVQVYLVEYYQSLFIICLYSCNIVK